MGNHRLCPNKRVLSILLIAAAISILSIAVPVTASGGSPAGLVQWKYPTDGYTCNYPIVVSGTVYDGSNNESFLGDVFALDAATGKVKWSTSTLPIVNGSISVVDGTVYAVCKDYTDDQHYLYTQDIYALDATTGEVKWDRKVKDATGLDGTPCVVDGIAYFSGSNGVVLALDSSTGEQKWEKATGILSEGDGVGGESSPVVAGGVVYVLSSDTGAQYKDSDFVDNVYALDAATGGQKWKYPIPGHVRRSPVVLNGIVYVNSENEGRQGNVYALDASTGDLKWYYPNGGQLSSPLAIDGVVYFGYANDTGTGYICALDAVTGAIKWKYPAGGYVAAKPVVANGVVYVGTGDPQTYAVTLHALDAVTGQLKWKGPADSNSLSWLAVDHGTVFAGCQNPQNSSRLVLALDAGGSKWSYGAGSPVWSEVWRASVADGSVYINMNSSDVYAIGSATASSSPSGHSPAQDSNPGHQAGNDLGLATLLSLSLGGFLAYDRKIRKK